MTNTTFFDTSNNLLDLFEGTIQQLPALPFFVLGAIAIIIFLANTHEDTKKVLMLEGYILTIVTGIFIALGWVDVNLIAFGIVSLLVGIITTLFIKKDY